MGSVHLLKLLYECCWDGTPPLRTSLPSPHVHCGHPPPQKPAAQRGDVVYYILHSLDSSVNSAQCLPRSSREWPTLKRVRCPARVCFCTGMIFMTSSLSAEPRKFSTIWYSFTGREKRKICSRLLILPCTTHAPHTLEDDVARTKLPVLRHTCAHDTSNFSGCTKVDCVPSHSIFIRFV